MYFTNVDYMIFTEENSANKSIAMIEERKRLQNKMLKLHEMIYSDVVKLGLSCHENKHHITTKLNLTALTERSIHGCLSDMARHRRKLLHIKNLITVLQNMPAYSMVCLTERVLKLVCFLVERAIMTVYSFLRQLQKTELL